MTIRAWWRAYDRRHWDGCRCVRCTQPGLCFDGDYWRRDEDPTAKAIGDMATAIRRALASALVVLLPYAVTKEWTASMVANR